MDKLKRISPPMLGGLIAAVVILADQLMKMWILYGLELPRRLSVEVLPFFDLTMVRNRGVSFGLLQADGIGRWLLSAFALAVAVMLAWWLRQAERRLLAAGLGLIIGGAIGNLIDRVTRGYVVDFFNFRDLYFPYVFNIADAAISIGVGMLLLDFVLNKDEVKDSARRS